MKKEIKTKNSIWKKVALLAVVLIVASNSWLIWQVSHVVNRMDKYNQGVVDEVGSVMGDVKLFADDLNEIRKFLLLPEKNYSVSGEVGDGEIEENERNNQNSVALFAMLDSFVKEEQVAKNKLQAGPVFEGLLVNQEVKNRLNVVGLSWGQKGDLQIKLMDSAGTFRGQPLFNLIFVSTENIFKVQSVLGEQNFSNYSEATFSNKLIDYLVNNTEAVRAKRLADQEAQAKAVSQSQEQVKESLENQKAELNNMVRDAAFVETLSAMGLKVRELPREENNKYIFDIVDAEGKIKFSLALEITSGMIKVIRDNREIDLKNFLEEEGSKKKL